MVFGWFESAPRSRKRREVHLQQIFFTVWSDFTKRFKRILLKFGLDLALLIVIFAGALWNRGGFYHGKID